MSVNDEIRDVLDEPRKTKDKDIEELVHEMMQIRFGLALIAEARLTEQRKLAEARAAEQADR